MYVPIGDSSLRTLEMGVSAWIAAVFEGNQFAASVSECVKTFFWAIRFETCSTLSFRLKPPATPSHEVDQLGFAAFVSFSDFVSALEEGGGIHLRGSFACDPYNGLLLHFGHNTVFSPLMF
jgi:hypothetical protein